MCYYQVIHSTEQAHLIILINSANLDESANMLVNWKHVTGLHNVDHGNTIHE